jgi:tetratricopeptide (TPR) repeat protein
MVTFFTACGPAGPRDLRKGERLIDSGRCADAIPVLGEGVELLRGSPPKVQAVAWNLLGLAYHGAGRPDAAQRAYWQALTLDRGLWAADYNLGCLCLERTNYAGGVDCFTAYATAHPKDINGFVLLGRANLYLAMERAGSERGRLMDNARRDFEKAEQLGGTAESANALGLISLQSRASRAEAVKNSVGFLKCALQRDAHYAPAILNLAIVLQRYADEPREALDRYHEYLALQPAPPQIAEVGKVARQLDLDLRITITSHPTEHPSLPPLVITNTSPPRQAQPAPEKPVSKPAPVVVVETRKTETLAVSTSAPVPPPVPAFRKPPAPAVAPPSKPSVNPPLSNPPAAPIKQTVFVPAQENPTPPDNLVEPTGTPLPEPKKNTFTQKINPLKWFAGKPKKEEPAELQQPPPPPVAENLNIERYSYPLPVTPIPGNRKLAEQLTDQGHHAASRAEAMRDYQNAIKADPTYFDPGMALGLAAIDAREYTVALDALNQALANQGNSADARYAFAWVLGKQGFYQDAANELSKLIRTHPREIRAYLLLGNYYADNLGRPKLARDQYNTALSLIDSHSEQAGAIRKWLEQHP